MADVTAEQNTRGWHEVERTLTALEFPPVPPTSDPQRLLGYALHVLPRYTEMEMLATHLRLYASTLEQDMEQVKSHVRLLTREVTGEREKKQFLERYAAQVVKERNDLLHSRGSSKKKASTASHFVWHNCCKKNTSHAMDLAPSILAFRGEKLHEATKRVESLQEEVHNQELLRKELDYLLKKTQREHDSKVAADRKHIQQLEKQIQQRSTLNSNLERKLYEVESVLARHDRTKEEELSIISSRIKEAQTHIASLEDENASLRKQVSSLGDDRDRLTVLLEETTESKDVFAKHIDELSEKCQSLESEVEALRSEIDMLQTKDINDIRAQYTARIDRLQKDSAASEEKLRQEIDYVKQQLKRRDELLPHALSVRQSTAKEGSRCSLSSQISGLESIPLPCDDSKKWSDGIFDNDRESESDEAGFSFSRSELSESQGSFSSLPLSGQHHSSHCGKVAHDNNNFVTQDDERYSTRRNYESSSKQGYSRELEAVSKYLSTSSEGQHGKSGSRTNVSSEPFDWETFIDSASLTVQDECTNSLFRSTTPRLLDLSTSTIHHDESSWRVLNASNVHCVDSLIDAQQQADEGSFHFSNAMDGESLLTRSLTEIALGGDEEEKKPDKDDMLVNKEQEQRYSGIVDSRGKQEQYENYQESMTEEERARSELAQDLYKMLNGLEQKRKEEEQKASQAEQALLEFQRLQQGLQVLQISSASSGESN